VNNSIFAFFSNISDRICATHKFFSQCEQMKRGNPMVECVHVQDSIECAARMRNNSADFGVFSAESTMHLARLGWDGMTVIKELRHKERTQEIIDFESVVLVKRPFEMNGLDNLRGLNFCHPGFHYGKPEKWSDRFLKHFERTFVVPACNHGSPAEIEVAALSQFFGSACRPGVWSHNPYEDAMLSEF
jgi:Transferrin